MPKTQRRKKTTPSTTTSRQEPWMKILEENEAAYRKFAPKNKKEADELLLAKLIEDKQQVLQKYLSEADGLKAQCRERDLEQAVHERVLKSHPERQEDWKYNWMPDFYAAESNQLCSLEDSIAYTAEWLKAARKMITTKRYHNIPKRFFDNIQWDGEGRAFWVDDMGPVGEESCGREDEGGIKVEDIPF